MNSVGLGDVRGGGEIDHLQFFVGGEIAQHGVEQEAVQLRFRQRVGAFELDGVLGGQHEERRRQFVIIAAHGAGELLHRFEQCRLRFGRGAVDFVGQQDVRKDGAAHEGPGAVAGGGIFLDDVGTGDVGGHQVRRKLDAFKNQAKRLGHGAHQQGLGSSRQTGDQAVAAHEQRDHDLFQDFFLAHDHAAHLRHDLLLHRPKALNARLEKFGLQLRRHGS
jgi:hypothetical protein